jgi:hypothetical protein
MVVPTYEQDCSYAGTTVVLRSGVVNSACRRLAREPRWGSRTAERGVRLGVAQKPALLREGGGKRSVRDPDLLHGAVLDLEHPG